MKHSQSTKSDIYKCIGCNDEQVMQRIKQHSQRKYSEDKRNTKTKMRTSFSKNTFSIQILVQIRRTEGNREQHLVILYD